MLALIAAALFLFEPWLGEFGPWTPDRLALVLVALQLAFAVPVVLPRVRRRPAA